MAKDYYQSIGISKEDMQNLAARYGLKKVALFGSFLHGNYDDDSDIDLCVSWESPPNLDIYFGFKEELEKLTHRSVDVVTEKSMFWFIRDKVAGKMVDIL